MPNEFAFSKIICEFSDKVKKVKEKRKKGADWETLTGPEKAVYFANKEQKRIWTHTKMKN